jgi:probable DNA repair protein
MALSDFEIKALQGGATLVCANRYLRDLSMHEYGLAMQAAGRSAWPSPDILTWPGWLARSFERVAESVELRAGPEPPALLSAAHERYLWRRIVAQSERTEALLHGPLLVTHAQSAWRRLREWQVPVASLKRDAAHEEARLFADWAERFEALLAQANWLDVASLPSWLRERCDAAAPAAPHLLRGLARPSPAERALLDVMHAGAARQPVAGAVQSQSCADELTEARMAASWIGARLAQHPEARAAILYPNRGQARHAIEALIHEFGTDGPAPSGTAERPWHDAIEQPLLRHPPIAAALDLLALTPRANDWAAISALLREPWLDPAERVQRMVLEAELRRRGEVQITLRELARIARGIDGLPGLGACLEAHRALLDETPKRQSGFAWGATFQRILNLWHWRATGAQGAGERAQRGLSDALDSLASLDLVASALTHAEALDWLRDALERGGFSATSISARIHLAPIAVAADARADFVWILGMHELAWPPPGRPHALLPMAVQRRYRMPEADGATRLLDARLSLEAALGRIATIVSFPQRMADGEDAHAAPFARACSPAGLASPSPLPGAWRRIVRDVRWESIVDDTAPALLPGIAVRGGTKLLDDQSACPFRAFATHRLHARLLEEPALGLDARARGQLVHFAMHACWKGLPSQDELLQLDEIAIAARAEGAAEQALRSFERRRKSSLPRRFRALERARLAALVQAALDLDRARRPFAIDSLEQRCDVQVGGLKLTLRSDRVDRLADRRALIVDYKSGEVTPSDWFGERPRACQLPLYAVARRDAAGIAFAQLKPGSIGYRGIVDGETQGAGLAPCNGDWRALLDEWRESLTRLGQEFGSGQARVDPQPHACERCDLISLCRIQESPSPYPDEPA